jgi:hypothetical protein
MAISGVVALQVLARPEGIRCSAHAKREKGTRHSLTATTVRRPHRTGSRGMRRRVARAVSQRAAAPDTHAPPHHLQREQPVETDLDQQEAGAPCQGEQDELANDRQRFSPPASGPALAPTGGKPTSRFGVPDRLSRFVPGPRSAVLGAAECAYGSAGDRRRRAEAGHGRCPVAACRSSASASPIASASRAIPGSASGSEQTPTPTDPA